MVAGACRKPTRLICAPSATAETVASCAHARATTAEAATAEDVEDDIDDGDDDLRGKACQI